MNERQRALFVASRSALEISGGGVQKCTNEFLATLGAAGFDLKVLPHDFDQSLVAKCARRIDRRPYRWMIPQGLMGQIEMACTSADIKHVFLNFGHLGEILGPLRKRLPGVRLTMLSHGLESADYLHEIEAMPPRLWERLAGPRSRRLANLLVEESRQRKLLDDVVTISEVEARLEQWIGARRVHWAPRSVGRPRDSWSPILGRAGFVGTLSHLPNLWGLRAVLRELHERESTVRIRIVGGPEPIGHQLAAEHPQAEFLGRLSNAEMLVESESWTSYLHPLFCCPRGASTKLATGLELGLPILTTSNGHRGYRWSQGNLAIYETANQFATAVEKIAHNLDEAEALRRQSLAVARSAPSADQVGAGLRQFFQ